MNIRLNTRNLPVLPSSRLIVIKIILLIVFPSSRLPVHSQDLQFYREDILFKIDKNMAVTDAAYHFCNVGDREIKTSLFYPFPDSTMDLIDSLSIIDLKSKTIIPYHKAKSGVMFIVSAPAYGQASYRVRFRQALKGHQYKYILTSTESWGRSLEFANYEVMTPSDVGPISFSYPPDTSFISGHDRIYLWKKKDFMPEKDFEVSFH